MGGSDLIAYVTHGKGEELTWDLALKMANLGIKGHAHTYTHMNS